MGQFGDYQSIFQLSAALAIGVLALEFFIDTPVARKQPEFQLLLAQIRKMLAKKEAPEIGNAAQGLVELQKDIENSIDKEFLANRRSNSMAIILMRGFAVVWALLSAGLLIASADGYHSPIAGWEFVASFVLLGLPIILTLIMLRISSAILERLENQRERFEDRFIKLVDIAWGLKPEHEG